MKVLAILLLVMVLLLGCAAMAQGQNDGAVLGELDALKYRLNNVSDTLGPELIRLQKAEYRVYEQRERLTLPQRLDAIDLANEAVARADRYEGEIDSVEQGLNAAASRYRPAAMSRVNATIAEGKMDILRADITRLRSDTAALRLSAERIRQMV
ncbi:MAG: hypothetical protein A4E28_03012 [Methanocella sp. PtaU1.Bin125]|nr:MAG: hypothetical protein A4E28_03012 [Methanocella sp. PtaU1.Bin125]